MASQSSKIPTPPADVVLSISSSSRIAAPASQVFRITTSPTTYSEWNTFATSAEVNGGASDTSATEVKVGSEVVMQCRMQPSDTARQTTKLRVTEVTVPPTASGSGKVYRVAWTAEGFGSKWMLRTNRIQEVEELDNGSCEFRTWEHMSGPLSYVVKRMYGEILQNRFEDWARDLKEYAEKSQGSSN